MTLPKIFPQRRSTCKCIPLLIGFVTLFAFATNFTWYQYGSTSLKRVAYMYYGKANGSLPMSSFKGHLIAKPNDHAVAKDGINLKKGKSNNRQKTDIKKGDLNSIRIIRPVQSTEYNKAYKYANKQLKTLVDDESYRKSKLNCETIFRNNTSEIEKAKQFKGSKHPYTDETYIEATRDCDLYRTLRGYYTQQEVSDDERSFPLAFGIVAHKDPGAFERLIRLIYRPHNFYCVHVDLKSPKSIFQAFAAIINCLPNVFLATKREIVVYAGFTMLQAHLNCFYDLLRYDWKYLLNYAGTELPLRPNNQVVRILRLQNNMSNIGMIKELTEGKQQRWLRTWKTEVNEATRTGRIYEVSKKNVPAPYGVKVIKNSVFGAFTHEFVSYIATDKRAQALIGWSKSTRTPDEHLFGTLFNGVDNPQLQVPGADTGGHPNLDYFVRFISWSGVRPCHGRQSRHTHQICIYEVGDLPYLSTVPHLGANKFSLERSVVAVDCIDWLVESRSRNITDVNLDYYRSMVSREKMNVIPCTTQRCTGHGNR